MNYKRIYDDLMRRASGRILVEYTEKHHITPRSQGGTDDISNIAVLTLREHFIAHQLLMRICRNTPHYRNMAFAVMKMATCNAQRLKLTSRTFAQIKAANAAERSQLSSRTHKGIKKTAEHRQKMSEAHKGKKREAFSQEWRANLSTGQCNRLTRERESSFYWEITSPTGEVYCAYLLSRFCVTHFGEDLAISAASNVRHKPYKGYTAKKVFGQLLATNERT